MIPQTPTQYLLISFHPQPLSGISNKLNLAALG